MKIKLIEVPSECWPPEDVYYDSEFTALFVQLQRAKGIFNKDFIESLQSCIEQAHRVQLLQEVGVLK